MIPTTIPFRDIGFGVDDVAAKIDGLLVAAVRKKHGNQAKPECSDHIALYAERGVITSGV